MANHNLSYRGNKLWNTGRQTPRHSPPPAYMTGQEAVHWPLGLCVVTETTAMFFYRLFSSPHCPILLLWNDPVLSFSKLSSGKHRALYRLCWPARERLCHLRLQQVAFGGFWPLETAPCGRKTLREPLRVCWNGKTVGQNVQMITVKALWGSAELMLPVNPLWPHQRDAITS